MSLPRTSVMPMLLIQRDGGRFEVVGPIGDVLTSDEGTSAPTVARDGVVADLTSLRTGELRMGLAVTVLTGIIGGMGGNPDTLKAAYAKSRRLTLELHNIREDSVAVSEVEKFLANSDLNPASRHTARLLHIGALYLVVSTLKSSQIDVEAEGRQSGEAAVSADALRAAGIQGRVSISGSQTTRTRVGYIGDEQLVFAFKAIQLSYRNGRFERYTHVAPNAATLGDTPVTSLPNEASEYLLPDAPMIDLG